MFALSFLAYTIAFVNGHPNAFSWTPKDSEDDVGFRSLSYGDVPTLDDFEKLDDLNDLDVEEDDSQLEYNFMRSNKRSPSSVSMHTAIFIFLHYNCKAVKQFCRFKSLLNYSFSQCIGTVNHTPLCLKHCLALQNGSKRFNNYTLISSRWF